MTDPETPAISRPAEGPDSEHLKPPEEENRTPGLAGVVIAALVLSVVAAMVGWRLGDSLRSDDPGAGSDVDLAIEQLDLPKLSGGRLGPADLVGKVVVLDFWATWCGPCHVQAKILDAIFEDYQGRVEILAVNVAEDRTTIETFVEDSPFPYPVLLDREGDASAAGGVFGLPTTVILDRDGKVAFRSTGVTTGRRLREVLDNLLAS